MAEEEEDTLGLDTPIQKARAKVARIDNDRLFNPVSGLPYIVKNYPKLVKSIEHNDRKFRGSKYQREHENLGKILSFYHLWAHGMFPKATFRDCIKLTRRFGDRSTRVKLWRRSLIEAEINKLKVKQGLITEEDAQENLREFSVVVNNEENASEAVSATIDDEDDYVAPMDFSFMESSLFVGAEGETNNDDVPSPSESPSAEKRSTSLPTPPAAPEPIEAEEEEIPSDIERQAMEEANNNNDDDDDDPFSDDDADILAAASLA
ncbi:hypothetical protein DIURU_001799 [Diutina rugosa]|uniref:Chromosome segregation in meiosis protein n=1 Tax=Diutina rugosa TaxID=5481 RepID=A0A642USV3_DIURU|nr:uncharacterized protein DIURU_001799 [Diutina rugosa]KAA8904845.1 hypothetical protein DIURU_001799 [Diutina rugosa]